MSDDNQYTIKELEADQIHHAVSMAEDAGMKPNTYEELDFFRINDTSNFVGLFQNDVDGAERDIPVGVVGILHDEERYYLNLLIVDKNHRRKGIGEKLVQWAIEKCRKEQRSKVLQLAASSMGSPLYKRLGFLDLGYTNLYEFKIKSGTKKAQSTSKQETRKQVLSFNLQDSATVANGQLLWSQATEMLLEATSSKAKTSRLVSLLKNSTVHLLYDATESQKPKLLAWGAVRRFSQKSHVIGPLIGGNVENIEQMVQEIIVNQAEREANQTTDSFVIHTDGQSGEEPQLAKALEVGGWEKVTTLEMLELPLISIQETMASPLKQSHGAKQYALTDFSHQ